MWRGARLRCPQCGAGTLFRAYLKLNEACPSCGADFSQSETADVAPHLTIFFVGLLCVPWIVGYTNSGQTAGPWLPIASLLIALALTLILLPRVKGVLAALLWRARRAM